MSKRASKGTLRYIRSIVHLYVKPRKWTVQEIRAMTMSSRRKLWDF